MSASGPPAAGRHGLCPACRHVREVRTARSVFLLCERSRGDERFPRYPAQPCMACPGFEPYPGRAEAADDPRSRR